MYVCMYACMYACMCVRVMLRLHLSEGRVCMYVCVNVCMYACTLMHQYIPAFQGCATCSCGCDDAGAP